MWSLSLLLLAAVIAAAKIFEVSAGDYPEENHVLALDEQTLTAAVRSFKKLFIMFYKPTCEYCKKAMPEFEKAAKKLHKESFDQVRLAKVDTSIGNSRDISTKYKITKVPAFFYHNGPDIWTMYYGEKKAADFISYVKKKAGHAWEEIDQVEAIDAFTADDDSVILGLFKDEASKEAEAFKTVATDIDGIPFGMSTSQEVFDHFGVKERHALIALKKFDEGRAYFDEEWDVDDLTDWIRKQRLPIVIDFSLKSANAIFTGETKRHILFVMKKSSPEFYQNYLIFKNMATKFRHQFLFVFVDADEKDYERIISFFQVGPRDYPAIRAVGVGDEPSKVLKPEDKTFSEEAITNFVRQVDSGKLAKRQNKKSEDEPSDWDDQNLKVLTARSFYQRIMGRDALVLFYTPSCKKCPDVIEIMETLAEDFHSDKTKIFAKIDASKNVVDRIEVSTFPAVKYFPKNINTALDYKGVYSVEAIKKYLAAYEEQAPQSGTTEKDAKIHSEL